MSKTLYIDEFEYSTDQLAQAAWNTDASGLTIDMMEYATDGAAQAAYVTSDSGSYSSDLCAGGIATADNDDGRGPDLAFDNNAGTFWATENVVHPHWIKYDFGSGNAHIIRRVRMLCAAGAEHTPKDFTIQGSNNDSDWDTLDTTVGGPQWAAGVYQVYDFANTTAYRYIMIHITASQLAANFERIIEIEMMSLLVHLQCYSESTIKSQGSYSLKAIAAQTGSLNDTLTKSGLSLDLTGIDTLKFDCYASRTGTNLQMQLKQYGSDITSGQHYFCNEFYSATFVPSKAFDDSTTWWNNAEIASDGCYIGIDFTTSKIIRKITVHNYSPYGFKNYKFEGTNDTVTYNDDGIVTEFLGSWTTIESGTFNDDATVQVVEFANATAYRYYRIIADGAGYHATTLAIREIEMMEVAYYTKDIAISVADIWEATTWDISAIADVDKDNIDSIIIKIINADAANTFYVDNFRADEDLQCYSEDTIKVQGDYSLKVLAAQTGSLNKTLTKTIVSDYLDYSIMDVIKLDIRASRTGSNIKLKIHDTGGVTSEHTINITSADTWQTEVWDISGIAPASRDSIDKIIIEIIEASASNTAYFDNLYSKVIVESAHVFIGG